MLPDYRAIMRARLGLGAPLEGFEGRTPRPQTLGNIQDFQPMQPEGWSPRPMNLGSMTDFMPQGPSPEPWSPHPRPQSGPIDYYGGGIGGNMGPEGRVPHPRPSGPADSIEPEGRVPRPKNPWQRF